MDQNMSISVSVIEIDSDEKTKELGVYEFIQLPVRHDRIVKQRSSGDIEIMRVLYYEHRAIKLPKEEEAGDPSVTLYVEFLGLEQY